MARNKPNETPHYELLYIVSNKYSEEELKPIMERVNKVITDHGGEITYTEEWGKKKFAYTIDHFKHGYYNLVEFDLPEGNLNEIDRTLQMDSDILRHMTVAKRKRTAEEIDQEKKKKAEPKPEPEKDKQEESKPQKDEEKVDMEQLDEKLDKILETDDLF